MALAKMKLPMAEVYEVATFYHHFEVLKDDAQAPGLTVRVCDGLSCEMAGAKDLLARLPDLLGAVGIPRDRRALPGPLRAGASRGGAPAPRATSHGRKRAFSIKHTSSPSPTNASSYTIYSI